MKFCFLTGAMLVVLAGMIGCKQSPAPLAVRHSEQTSPPSSAEAWTARGQVVDSNGLPINDVDVATYWSSNGKLWGADGKVDQNMTEEALKGFWANEGQMEPFPQHQRTIQAEGFQIETPAQHSCIALALNADRTLGGIDSATPDTMESMKIVMKPLVRVFGKLRCSGEVPEWTNVSVHYPDGLKAAPD